jgi:outer membrane protein assembly factor BamA
LRLKVVGCLLIALTLLPAGIASAQPEAPSAESDTQYAIGSIKVVGNVSIETEKILRRVRSKVGDFFDADRANEDVERIAGLIGVGSATYQRRLVDGKIEMTFVIVEKDIVRSIEFIGNRTFGAKSLRKRLGFMMRDYFDLFLAESGNGARGILLEEGFCLCSGSAGKRAAARRRSHIQDNRGAEGQDTFGEVQGQQGHKEADA